MNILVPRQALRSDPLEVRNNPATPANVRSGNLLLCRKLYKNSPMYNNGCNSWKGRLYDKPISDIFPAARMLKASECLTLTSSGALCSATWRWLLSLASSLAR